MKKLLAGLVALTRPATSSLSCWAGWWPPCPLVTVGNACWQSIRRGRRRERALQFLRYEHPIELPQLWHK